MGFARLLNRARLRHDLSAGVAVINIPGGGGLMSGFRIDYLFHSGDCCEQAPDNFQASQLPSCPTDIRPHDACASLFELASIADLNR
jgi:hypothetical protein